MRIVTHNTKEPNVQHIIPITSHATCGETARVLASCEFRPGFRIDDAQALDATDHIPAGSHRSCADSQRPRLDGFAFPHSNPRAGWKAA